MSKIRTILARRRQRRLMRELRIRQLAGMVIREELLA